MLFLFFSRDSSCSATLPHAKSQTCHDKALQLFHPISKPAEADMAAQLPVLFASTFPLHVSSPRFDSASKLTNFIKVPMLFSISRLASGSCNVQSAPLQPATRQVSSPMPLLGRPTYSSPFSMQSWQPLPMPGCPFTNLTGSLRKPSFHVSSRQSPSPMQLLRWSHTPP